MKLKRRASTQRLFGKKKPWAWGFFRIGAVLFLGVLGVRFFQERIPPSAPKKPAVSRPVSRPVRTPGYSRTGPAPSRVPPPERSEYFNDPFPGSAGQPAAGLRPAPYLPARLPSLKLWKTSGRPWAPSRPKIVFVIDDCGHNRKNERLFRALGNQVTYAVLPRLPYSAFMGRLSRETEAEVILHQPLESEIGKNPGPGLIRRQMNSGEVEETMEANLATVPNFSGINNHMGSLGTQDRALMRRLLELLKKRGAFFLDSRTTMDVASPQLAPSIGIPVLFRDFFLDNENEKTAIRSWVERVKALSREQGYAIAIGHDRPFTLEVLLEEIPRLEAEGFQVVSLGDLIEHRIGA